MTAVPDQSLVHTHPPTGDDITIGRTGRALLIGGLAAALLGLGSAVAIALFEPDGTRRFLFAYLVSFAFFLSLSLGALFFVVLQHLTRSGWSVSVRRVAELFASNVALWAVTALVIVAPMALGSSELYVWVDAARVARDEALAHKSAYLNVPFFVGRCLVYFGVWLLLSRYYLTRSVAQDTRPDPGITRRLERWSAPGMVLFALTVTFAAFDFLMSLEPHWSSTMFGVYFFAGCVVGFFALFAIALVLLQGRGLLARSISTEHYHDVGKLLFAFTFFWGYIAFSQFMLIWYANIPEETEWYAQRMHGGWAVLGLALLFGHFVLPFVALLPRGSKRQKPLLAMLAALMLIMHWLDLYWVVMPTRDGATISPHVLDLLCLVGLGGLYVAGFALAARKRALMAVGDPRLGEAVAFENV